MAVWRIDGQKGLDKLKQELSLSEPTATLTLAKGYSCLTVYPKLKTVLEYVKLAEGVFQGIYSRQDLLNAC
jgi:hypothetical protein